MYRGFCCTKTLPSRNFSIVVVVVEVNCQLCTFIFPFLCMFSFMTHTKRTVLNVSPNYHTHNTHTCVSDHHHTLLYDYVLKKLFQFLSFYFLCFWHVTWVVIVIVGSCQKVGIRRKICVWQNLLERIHPLYCVCQDNEKADKGRNWGNYKYKMVLLMR